MFRVYISRWKTCQTYCMFLMAKYIFWKSVKKNIRMVDAKFRIVVPSRGKGEDAGRKGDTGRVDHICMFS